MKLDPYKVLHIDRDATLDKIKKAYRRLITKWHPDRNLGNEKAVEEYKKTQWAYDLLSDSERRKAYDQYGHTGDLGPTHAQAMEAIAGTFHRVLMANQNEIADLVKMTRDELQNQKSEALNATIRLKEQLTRHHKIKSNLIEPKEDNVMVGMMDKIIEDIEGAIKRLDHEIAIFFEALKILGAYKYKSSVYAYRPQQQNVMELDWTGK